MSQKVWRSWSMIEAESQYSVAPRNRLAASELSTGSRVIYANGRSYSDIALPQQGAGVIETLMLNSIVSFDREAGLIEVEAGATLAEVQQVTMKDGWGLFVLPGTAHVTVGGALANDVHGKNHHTSGSFGNNVVEFSILRDSRLGVERVSRSQANLWAATVGGLGATGLILTVVLRLKKWQSDRIKVKQKRFQCVSEFLEMSNSTAEYTVGWVDALSSPIRGVFFEGTHSDGFSSEYFNSTSSNIRSLRNPLPTAKWIGSFSTKLFNELYWASHKNNMEYDSDWKKFFCPLDNITGWNRLYGSAGFQQFQCRLPLAAAKEGLDEIFKSCRRANLGSFLSVIKTFGSLRPEGILSFASEGVTFAMDFPQESGTDALVESLCRITLSMGGGLYPAKVCIPNSDMFAMAFPQWKDWHGMWSKEFGNCHSLWIKRAMKGLI